MMSRDNGFSWCIHGVHMCYGARMWTDFRVRVRTVVNY